MSSLAGTALGDLFVFGDVRDAVREGSRLAAGEEADELILGLACVGLVITAGTYATVGEAGIAAPVVAVRAAREAVKVEKAQDLVHLVGDVGRVQAKAGTQAALEGLKLAETPQEMSKLARLAAAKGGKTRAILKLTGRAAIVLAMGTFDLALWIFWAIVTAFGFVSSFKRMAERITERHCARRRLRRAQERRARDAQAAMSAAVAPA
jgi:hypothetical protein